MDVDKVTSQRSDIYYQDEKAGVWSELKHRGGGALHVSNSLSIVKAIAPKINVEFF